MTEGGNTLPNLIIPGAQKSGTTYLTYLLGQHHDIFLPIFKEPSHFLTRLGRPIVRLNGQLRRYAYSDRATYRRLFEGGQDVRYRVDASTGYFDWPDVARLIREEVGEAKIICVVRQPVDRAYSAFVYHRQLEDTACNSFEEALSEQEALMKDPGVAVPHPYFGTGRYADHIEVWQEVFGEQNVHVVFFEDLRNDPQGVCDAIFAFLGVSAIEVDTAVERNTSHEPLSGWRKVVLKASRGDYAIFAPVTFALRFMVPPALRNRIRVYIKRNLRPAPGSKRPPKLSAAKKAEYTREFESDIDRLAQLTGRSLSHWKNPQ